MSSTVPRQRQSRARACFHAHHSLTPRAIFTRHAGIRPVLVAGCRPQIRKRLEQLGQKSRFVNGVDPPGHHLSRSAKCISQK